MTFNPCCCIKLRTGAIIIGVLEIVLNSLFLIVTSVGLGGLAVIKSLDENGTLMRNITEEIQKEHGNLYGAKDDQLLSLLMTLLGLVAIMCVLKIIMGSVLIHGIRKEKLTFLKIWLIFQLSCIVLSFVLAISMAFAETKGVGQSYPNASSSLMYLLEIYFVFVVYRLFIEMRENLVHRPKPKYQFS